MAGNPVFGGPGGGRAGDVSMGYATNAQEATAKDARGRTHAPAPVISARRRTREKTMKAILKAIGAVLIGVACVALPILIFLLGGE